MPVSSGSREQFRIGFIGFYWVAACVPPESLADPAKLSAPLGARDMSSLELKVMIQSAILNFLDFQCFTIFRSTSPMVRSKRSNRVNRLALGRCVESLWSPQCGHVFVLSRFGVPSIRRFLSASLSMSLFHYATCVSTRVSALIELINSVADNTEGILVE